MLPNMSELFRRSALVAVTVAAALPGVGAADASPGDKIIIDTKVSPAFNGQVFGDAGQYETIAGRVFGEIDPRDHRHRIINDIDLAPKNSRGNVEYMATFFLVKPIDMSKASGLLWQDVPNRGGRITISVRVTAGLGDVGLSSGWQGDNSGGTAHGRAGYATTPSCRLRRTRTAHLLLAPSWDESSTRAAPTRRR